MVVQPRGWNTNFVKSNFMHSHEISAKSDIWNPSKQHIFYSKLVHFVEAVLASKVQSPNFFQLILKIKMLIDLQITGRAVYEGGDLVFLQPEFGSDSDFELP